eukprot:CAMPEP_0175154736 /NCGR_PEP_ID=MMETSP0087-20121206/20538_1 /TAXON_ID=136419 /ORGANISM="Unknown Unknown, Strain D1" /LENGTH=322 /DNA_ID=CAMNT_0016441719 /DNA_START=5 /DNA_END=973 /DNA_ORIENTATION=+
MEKKGPSSFESTLAEACNRIQEVQKIGGQLLILTGAGMSVSSGVPVFRNKDGSMSSDFVKFLSAFNQARAQNNLPEVTDWFHFSMPHMFRKETAKPAWAYWRWRTLRALVKPAHDYDLLMKLVAYFGPAKSFAITSNCDSLHVQAGMPAANVEEIHGSLCRLQCSEKCSETLFPVDATFLKRLEEEPDWVPQCPACKVCCLRPNVMIFGDDVLVETMLEEQEDRRSRFTNECKAFKMVDGQGQELCGRARVVLELGAGVVVPSIRMMAEKFGSTSAAFIRINPSAEESEQQETTYDLSGRYFPIVEPAAAALEALVNRLGLC